MDKDVSTDSAAAGSTRRVAALLIAAGSGQRVGCATPKQYRRLAGQAVIAHAAAALLRHPGIATVAAVIAPDHHDLYHDACAGLPLAAPIDGGAERQDSVRLGLEALAALAPDEVPDRVLIHDAARPFLPQCVIDRLLAALDEHCAALPTLPVVDTIKRVSGTAPSAGFIAAHVDRADLIIAQTPQAFDFKTIIRGHRELAGAGLSDDTAIVERLGLPVATVAGAHSLFKITEPEDFARASQFLSRPTHANIGDANVAHANNAAAGLYETRMGTGFDVHRLSAGAPLVLCGITVPHDHGLAGHSDADVGLHALTDAVLGAIAEGDIGHHFPPSDPQWRGAASDRFLRFAGELVRRRGGAILHLDVTLICERPRIGPYRDRMRARIAEILTLSPDRVSVKATTSERLGFTGRGEGIAAQAAASIRLPHPLDEEAGGWPDG